MFDIPKTMRAVVYRGPNDLRVEIVPVPAIKPDELLVKVAVCGVCPTDIKKIHYGTVPPPRIFGHETAGTIVRIGARVKKFRIGDRVGLHHHVPCLKCHVCRHGAFAQCETYKRTGITAGFEPAGGGYAEYVRVMPFVFPGIVKIPAKNSFVEGAMLEPVNTVLKAVKRLNLLPGDNVLVAGQGPIGLMFTKLLALRGMKVIATDLLESRLQLAKKFGAKFALNAASDFPHEPVAADVSPLHLKTKSQSRLTSAATVQEFNGGGRRPGEEETRRSEIQCANQSSRKTLPEAIAHLTRGKMLDAAIIAVPSDAAVAQAMQLVRGGGQVLLFAHTRKEKVESRELRVERKQPATSSSQHSAINSQLLPLICVDEKDLIGSYSSDVTLQPEVAKIIFNRKLDVRKLITHEFSLEKTADAIALAAKPTIDSLKIVVTQ